VIIVDTNVISELMRPLPSPAVVAWLSRQPPDNVFTTTITVAEVLYGVESLPKGKRREALLKQAEATFSEDFSHRILTFDEQSARMFASITVTRRTHGHPIGILDAQIAAISKVHGATLATRNTVDFEGCGVRLINPWQS
jgi:predicted nucleic acid-binding protein